VSSFFQAARWPFGIAVGTAVGGAAAGAITPGVQEIINAAWAAHAIRPPGAALLATGFAEGKVAEGDARQWAAETGYGAAQFDALVEVAHTGPGVPSAFELWRRGEINEAGFRRACKRAALEPEWIGALVNLHDRLLSPSDLANARQQEFIDDRRLHSEGAKQGYTNERMDLLYKMAGLPPGAMDGLTMLRRGIISEATYRAIVAEGHTKTKYTDDLLALQHQILSATEWASLWLRGWATEAEAKAGGALQGYDGPAMDRLYQNRGRPATVRQAHIGYARGGRLPGVGNNEKATIRRSVEESNIRSEWFDILYSQRYTYPSAFVLRALATDGTFTQAQTEQILLESGWKPEWAKAASEKWSGGGAGPSAKWADRAKSRVFTTARADYLAGDGDELDVRPLLTAIGAVGAEQDSIIRLWDLERSRIRRGLTQAQILKLYKKSVWTREQALAGLDDLGMEDDEANDLLDAV
jgi:hypothetical protein